jgi:hypothetical protein
MEYYGSTRNVTTNLSHRTHETVIEDHEESDRGSEASYTEKNYGLEREHHSKTEQKLVKFSKFTLFQ